MLRKILVSQLRFGMYVHGLDGSWFDHSFWRSKFLLTDPADLQALRSSGVKALWIDTGKGVDVETATPPAAESPQLVSDAVPVAPRPTAASAQQCSVQEEMQRAAQVLKRSKQQVASLFNEARLGKAVDPAQCLPLVEEISASLARNGSALLGLARLKTRDEYTYMHSVAVCALMVALARQLGMAADQVREAGMAGLLHDIGKMAMPLEVLNKPGKLDDDEFAIMRSHPERGHAILLNAQSSVSEAVLDVCLHHHEKVDGTGYPHRLAGEQISLLARMGAICDVYDAITSNRPYKTAWDASGSLAKMAQWQGHFDTQLLHAFVRAVGIYPLGTLVRLQSGRLGVVIEQNPQQLTAPRLKLFYSSRTRAAIPQQELDLSDARCDDRIVAREDPAAWGFGNLDELWT
ncbi:HD-GYP domain-containing protein [Pseudomonas sp. S5(2021)]|nr:HD-GYP domain-containing protein [Pseudomonas sp. S5(2021)]